MASIGSYLKKQKTVAKLHINTMLTFCAETEGLLDMEDTNVLVTREISVTLV